MSTAVVCCDFIKKLKVPSTPYEKAVKAIISARCVRILTVFRCSNVKCNIW